MSDGIYVMGGMNVNKNLSSVEKYDFHKNKWINLKSMNFTRSSFSCISSPEKDYIYVVGGDDKEPHVLDIENKNKKTVER